MDDLVQEFYSANRQHRVNVYRRETGTFYFQEERFSSREFERSWIPLRQSAASFFDTQETAIKEARGRVEWLSDLLDWS